MVKRAYEKEDREILDQNSNSFKFLADGVVLIDKNFKIISFSEGAERITGYKFNEVIGKNCYDAFESDMCGEDCPTKITLDSGDIISNVQFHIQTKDKKIIPIVVSTSPLKDKNNKIVGVVQVFRNVAEVKFLTEERREDIPLLVEHFLKKFNEKFNKKIEKVSDDVMDLLIDYHWSGNVRELENVIEHTFIHCRGQTILLEHLPDEVKNYKSIDFKKIISSKDPFEEAEREIILNALKKNNSNLKKTAKCLGIDRTTLYRKIKKLKISIAKLQHFCKNATLFLF